MATHHSTPSRDITFTAVGPIYQAKSNATRSDVSDYLNVKLGQLCAMLMMIHGDGLEPFSALNDTLRDDYLWSCSMISDECKELVERL